MAIRVVIRDAQREDVDVLRDLFRRSSLSNDTDRDQLLANPDMLDWAADLIDEGTVRVAVVDEHVVGFATTIAAGDEVELEDLFVDPAWMRHGIGSALVDDAVAIGRAGGGRRLAVTANEQAVPFYERAGFVVGGVAETAFGQANRLFRDLSPE